LKLLIIHLSDIHFQADHNPIDSRPEIIKAAIQGADSSVDARLLVVTGDIASTGSGSEYAVALRFFKALNESIRAINPATPFHAMYVPGNHDCDFRGELDARQNLIDTLGGSINKLNKGNSIISICTAVQEQFFEFLGKVSDGDLMIEEKDRIQYQRILPISNTIIRVNCYNTAWVSQRREIPKQLYFPLNVLVEDDIKYDLTLSLFHHPYTWLHPDNTRAFRKYIEKTSDIVLTGHEHDSDYSERKGIGGDKVYCTEGGLLQESGTPASTFNLLIVDLGRKRMRVCQYDWGQTEGIYRPRDSADWQEFHRNKALTRQQFENSEDFHNFLNSVGVAFTHPVVDHLRLHDLFVYPDLEEQQFDRESRESVFSVISGDRILDYVASRDKILFIGDDLSGKTSLAKSLYVDLKARALVPILMDGEFIRSTSENDLIKLSAKKFQDQYDPAYLEQFKQLNTNAKVLIIDDFHKTVLNKAGQNEFLAQAAKHYGKIVVFADKLFPLERLAQREEGANSFLAFRVVLLREFGHLRRSELIEKWYKLGREHTIEEDELSYAVAGAEKLVDTVLGRRLIPALPLFILTILQTREATIPLNTSGAYGQYYEFLINQALTKKRLSKSASIIYTYLSRIAYDLFDSHKATASDTELRSINERYFREIKVRVDHDEILRDLLSAGMLEREDGVYRFTYRYYYYYFVAYYIAKNLNNPSHAVKLRSEVTHLIENIHVEDFANILIFLIYLTMNLETINQIVGKAKGIYDNQDPCDLAEHVKFINELSMGRPKLALDSGDINQKRKEYRERLDEIEESNSREEHDGEQRELDEVMQLNVSFKTLQIMGQILRNFPGSLEGDLKLQIARECYLLGLRTLRSLFSMFELHLDDLRDLISNHVSEVKKITDERELRRRTDQFLFYLGMFFAYGLIKKISSSVGSEDLKETYREVLEENRSMPMSLIDICIKIDHFKHLPSDEIIDLYESVRKNLFSSTVLRHMVWDFLQLYPIRREVRERVCRKLDIRINDPKIISKEPKMLR
jgi:Calcineurin-like phosphoesterase